MSNKKIIFATIIILFLSSIFLDYRETLQENPNYQKNWWSASFDDPSGESIAFAIDNHSSAGNFHWEVSLDKKNLISGDVNVANGNRKDIPLNISELGGGKIAVTVTANGNNKEELDKTLVK